MLNTSFRRLGLALFIVFLSLATGPTIGYFLQQEWGRGRAAPMIAPYGSIPANVNDWNETPAEEEYQRAHQRQHAGHPATLSVPVEAIPTAERFTCGSNSSGTSGRCYRQ